MGSSKEAEDSGATVAGDPFATQKKEFGKDTAAPDVVIAFHARSDVDSSTTAQHHTLGLKHDQSAPGDHKHDGKSSRRLMEGITITGAKGGNAALADLIDKLTDVLGFTDNTT